MKLLNEYVRRVCCQGYTLRMTCPMIRIETELGGFLGLVGYYRRFIPRCAQIAGALHQLVSDCKSWKRKKSGKKNSTSELDR